MSIDTVTVPRPFVEVARSEDRQVWLQARKQGIGASEVAAVLGLSPWESAYTVWARKRGLLDESESNERMRWGARLETAIAEGFAEETGRLVRRGGFGGVLLRSRCYPWLLATPDFEQIKADAPDLGLLECKTTGEDYALEWQTEPPVFYQAQLQQQLLVTGLAHGTLACLIGGQSLRWQDAPRHERFQAMLVKRTEAFWRMVEEGTPPALDDSESTFRTLSKIRETGAVVDLPAFAVEWHERMVAAAEARRVAEAEHKACKRLLAAAMGDASFGRLPDGKGYLKFVTVEKPAHVVRATRYRDLRYVSDL
jgi:putative phage-type endonuclease